MQVVMKIMSKMGIATIASYRNSGLFDILGLNRGDSRKSGLGGGKEVSTLGGLGYQRIIGS